MRSGGTRPLWAVRSVVLRPAISWRRRSSAWRSWASGSTLLPRIFSTISASMLAIICCWCAIVSLSIFCFSNSGLRANENSRKMSSAAKRRTPSRARAGSTRRLLRPACATAVSAVLFHGAGAPASTGMAVDCKSNSTYDKGTAARPARPLPPAPPWPWPGYQANPAPATAPAAPASAAAPTAAPTGWQEQVRKQERAGRRQSGVSARFGDIEPRKRFSAQYRILAQRADIRRHQRRLQSAALQADMRAHAAMLAPVSHKPSTRARAKARKYGE